jgi:DNA-binding transcriptional MerR regulator
MSSTYIKIKDVADILRVSRATLRNWDANGKLKAHRHPFNNYRVYKIADINRVLEIIESSESSIRKKKDQVRKLAIQHD